MHHHTGQQFIWKRRFTNVLWGEFLNRNPRYYSIYCKYTVLNLILSFSYTESVSIFFAWVRIEIFSNKGRPYMRQNVSSCYERGFMKRINPSIERLQPTVHYLQNFADFYSQVSAILFVFNYLSGNQTWIHKTSWIRTNLNPKWRPCLNMINTVFRK